MGVITFAAVFEVFIIADYVISYIFFIGTALNHRNKGLASGFIRELAISSAK